MSFLETMKQKLGIGSAPPPPAYREAPQDAEEVSPPPARPVTVAQSVGAQPPPARPAARKVIEAPLLMGETEEVGASEDIKIKAQPSRAGDECKFMVNRPIFAGHSWFFKDTDAAKGSPLAEVLFAADGDVETVLLHNTTVTLTRKNKADRNWEPLAKNAGAALRAHLESGAPVVAQEIVDSIAPEDEIRQAIQHIIEAEVNPGIAAHGGVVTLLDVTGNTVTVKMGGGCQGCSAAALTLKDGIEQAFRKTVPSLGALVDATDHAAGLNPYFT